MSRANRTFRFALKAVARAVVGCLAIGATNTLATDFDWSVGSGLGYSDNIGQDGDGGSGESIALAELQLSLSRESSRFDVNMFVDMAYHDYLGDTWESQFAGNANASGVLRLLPERLEWSFQDNFGQIRRDPFAKPTPANREDVNYFSTGPDLAIVLGGTNQIRLAGRYSAVSYQTTPLNNERFAASVALAHELSTSNEVAAYAQSEKIRFDQGTSNADYERQAMFLRYSLERGRTEALLDAGVYRVSGGQFESDGNLLRLDIFQMLGRHSTVAFNLGRELTDAGAALGATSGLESGGLYTPSLVQTADPYVRTYAGMTISTVGRRTNFAIEASRFEEDYGELSENTDRKGQQFAAHLERAVGGGWSTRVQARLDEFKHDRSDLDFQELVLSASARRRFGRNIFMELTFERTDRNGNLIIGTFAENRAWLQFNYGEAPERAVRSIGSPRSDR